MAGFAAVAVKEKVKPKDNMTEEMTDKTANKTANKTGIPTGLKERLETASGISLSDVRIHYNSDRPAKVGAWAYAQGDHVYMGRGQERYLPHELGHVIQQRMGIVKPTAYSQGLAVNDDPRLERQADEIGRGVAQRMGKAVGHNNASDIVQMTTIRLKEIKGRDAEGNETVGYFADGDSTKSGDKSFGGFQGIQDIFASRIRPMRYIRKSDIERDDIGNVWEFDREFTKAEGKVREKNEQNKEGNMIEIHTRSQYQCAEPKAFASILQIYQKGYTDSIQSIKMEIISAKSAIIELREMEDKKKSLEAQMNQIKSIRAALQGRIRREDDLENEWDGMEEQAEECQEEEELSEEEQLIRERMNNEKSKHPEKKPADILNELFWECDNKLTKLKEQYGDLEKNINLIRNSQAVKKYEENLQEMGRLDQDDTKRVELNEFIGRLRFDPAQNLNREDAIEPTCPVCQQWVDKHTLRIKSFMHL